LRRDHVAQIGEAANAPDCTAMGDEAPVIGTPSTVTAFPVVPSV